MSLASSPASTEQSALRRTIASPLHRGAAIAMFLSGLGMAAAVPQITSFLVADLGAPLSTAGLVYFATLTSPVGGYLVGARSDRTGKRLVLFRLCALAGFLGWFGIAVSTAAWQPFVIVALVLAFAPAAGSQLFAAVHDDLEARGGANGDGVVAIIRMAFSAGWVLGPGLGFALVAAAGFRVMFVVAALCTIAQVVPLGIQRTPDARPAPAEPAPADETPNLPRQRRIRLMLPLLVFTGLNVLVYAGDPIKYAYLPIYMRELHLSAVVSGAVIGIQPLVELAVIPLAVVVSRRIGVLRLMVIGAVLGIGGNLCFALTASAAGMFAGQVLIGGVWGVFAALGIIVAQRLLPQAVATGTAVFLAAPAFANALGGLTGALGVSVLGIPLVYLAPAFLSLLAAVGLAVMSRARLDVR